MITSGFKLRSPPPTALLRLPLPLDCPKFRMARSRVAPSPAHSPFCRKMRVNVSNNDDDAGWNFKSSFSSNRGENKFAPFCSWFFLTFPSFCAYVKASTCSWIRSRETGKKTSVENVAKKNECGINLRECARQEAFTMVNVIKKKKKNKVFSI